MNRSFKVLCFIEDFPELVFFVCENGGHKHSDQLPSTALFLTIPLMLLVFLKEPFALPPCPREVAGLRNHHRQLSSLPRHGSTP